MANNNDNFGMDPDKWAPVDTPALGTAGGGPPASGANPFLSGSIAPNFQNQPPALISTQNKSHGTYDLMPIPPSGNAQANAGAISAVQGAITDGTIVVPSTPSGSEVTLTMPPQYAVSGSPGDNLGVTWLNVPPEYVLSGPNSAAIGYDSSSFATGGIPSGTGAIAITSPVPSNANEWALYVAKTQGSSVTGGPGVGWTAISSGQNSVYTQQLTGAAASASQPFSGTGQFAAMIALFSGNIPTFVQSAQAGNGGSTSTVTFPSSVGAGNSVLVVVQGTLNSGSPVPIFISDFQGLDVNFVGTTFTGTSFTEGAGASVTLYVLEGLSAGSESVTFTVPTGLNSTANCAIFEITPLTAINAQPKFQPLFPIQLDLFGNGGVIGNLPVTNLASGTGATSSTYWNGSGAWVAPNYQTVESPTSGPLPAQPKLNFKDTFVLSNDAGSTSTDVTELAGSINLSAVPGTTAPTAIITGTVTTGILYEIDWYINVTTTDVGTLTVTVSWTDTTTTSLSFPAISETSATATSGTCLVSCSSATSPTIGVAASGSPSTLGYTLKVRALPRG